MEQVLRVLPWVLPPALGAVIGYVTNALAIKMLFRPLVEKRIFGIRVPLTPGIIPRRRFQLSESIARMVSTKLLTEEVLVAKIESEEFQASLRTSVGKLTSELLDGTATGKESGASSSDAGVIVDQFLNAFFSGDAFRRTAVHLSSRLVEGAFQLDAATLLPSDEKLRQIVSHLLEMVTGERTRKSVAGAARQWVDGHLRANTELKQLLGRPLIAAILVAAPRLYDPVVQTLLDYLKQPSTRTELAISGRELLKRILKRLNVVQRILVSATQYQKNLNENMPGIVDDVIQTLETAASSDHNRHRVIAAARRMIVRWANTGLADLARLIDFEPALSVPRLVREVTRLLSRSEVRFRIEELAVQGASELRARAIGEIIEQLLGIQRDEIAEQTVAVVERWTSDAQRMQNLATGLGEFIRRLTRSGDRSTIRAVLPLSADQEDALNDWLTDISAVQIKRRVPELLRGIDVHAMVVDKIDSLDVKDVEDLLLMVIARHLKWINLFGALLGSLIGGLQIALNVLT